tara:strand:- start:2092 stop:5046 length:2955 start_codon:yes stop_codon:yes gene_type:complete
MPTPATISRFEVKRELGHGGMGLLYLALDPVIDRLVAVKLLRVDTEEMRARFLREARTAGRLQHKNIVTIYDVGIHDDQPFIAMEYIKGETLSEIFSRKATFSVDQKLELLEQLCDGLACAHDAGLIHRDIKPANLMVAEGSNELKILDFGIARSTDLSGFTQTGAIIGTPNYMSPEQAQGRPVDYKSDIFSVGAVVYEFLTYRRAFPGRGLRAVIDEVPRPVAEVVPSLPSVLDDIVNSALTKSPDDRCQSLRVIASRLASVRKNPGTHVGSAVTIQSEDALAASRIAAEDATEFEKLFLAASENFREENLEKALILVNEALDITPSKKCASLKAQILDVLDARDKERGRRGSIHRGLQAGRDHLRKGAVEAALRAADEVLAYDEDNRDALKLKEDAQRLSSEKDAAKQDTTVVALDDLSGRTVDVRQAPTARKRPMRSWVAASAIGAVVLVVFVLQFNASRTEEQRIQEALTLYSSGQRDEALSLLEDLPSPSEAEAEALDTLRSRLVSEAADFVEQATVLVGQGLPEAALELLRSFSPPDEGVTALLREIEAAGSGDSLELIGQAQDLYGQGLRQDAFDLLATGDASASAVQETLAELTARWEDDSRTLTQEARSAADEGNLEEAIALLESFSPSDDTIRAALEDFRGRLGTIEAARAASERSNQLFVAGQRVEALRILDEFSPATELISEERRRLQDALVSLATARIDEARQLAVRGSLDEAVTLLGRFEPRTEAVAEALSELSSELNRQVLAAATVADAQQLAAEGNWDQAFARFEEVERSQSTEAALDSLRREWNLEATAVAADAQALADSGDLAGALRTLAQFRGGHPAITVAENRLAALVNAPAPEAVEAAPAASDPTLNLEARLLALSDQSEDIVSRFIELYEDLDAEGMTSVWRTATESDLAPLAETFRNFRSAEIQYRDCDPELRNDTSAVVYCSVAVEYQPVAGARLQVPAVGWQFELRWENEEWRLVNWSR